MDASLVSCWGLQRHFLNLDHLLDDLLDRLEVLLVVRDGATAQCATGLRLREIFFPFLGLVGLPFGADLCPPFVFALRIISKEEGVSLNAAVHGGSRDAERVRAGQAEQRQRRNSGRTRRDTSALRLSSSMYFFSISSMFFTISASRSGGSNEGGRGRQCSE